jgi:ABC-type spermidine/putrescine transport system permease subunit II
MSSEAMPKGSPDSHGSTSSQASGAWRQRAAGLPIYVWLLVLVIAPNFLLILTSFLSVDSGNLVYTFNLGNYTKIFTSYTVQYLAFKTLFIALMSAIIATAIAYPLAYYVSRGLTRGKSLAAMLIVLPLWISLLMRIFAWRVILGDRGLLNSALMNLGVISEPSKWLLYTSFSVLLTMISITIPYVFIAAFTAIERVPQSLIEAARDNGASAFRTFTTVVWPLTRQGTAIGFALAVLIAVGDFVTPAMVGGLNGTMLGSVIQSQFGISGNWPAGAAMSVYLLILVMVVIMILLVLTRTKGILAEVDAGAAPRIEPWKKLSPAQKARRAAARVLLVIPYIYLYAPLFVIFMFSFNDSTVQSLPLTAFTLKWYQQLPGNSALLDAVWLTFKLALAVTAGGSIVATVFAFTLAGWSERMSAVLGNLIALPIAVPGVVLGISMVMTASLLHIPPGFWRLLLGHLTFVMPVILLVVLGRLRRVDPNFALASRDLGANWWQTMARIQLPMIKGAIFGGALLGFTLSIDEVMVSLFLAGSTPTLPVYVWNQTRFGFTPSVNAIFSCIGVVSLILVIFARSLLETTSSGSRA